jgi:hypothetical protein
MLLKGKVVIPLVSANEVRKGTFLKSFDIQTGVVTHSGVHSSQA